MTDKPLTDLPDLVDADDFSISLGTPEEEQKKFSREWTVFAPDIYVAEVVDCKKRTVDNSKFAKGENDKVVDRLFFTLNLLRTIEGNAVMDVKGQVASYTKVTVGYIDPEATGYSKKDGSPMKTRAFMTAALGLPSEANLTKVTRSDLLGRRMKVIIQNTEKDGIKRSNVISFMPVAPVAIPA